MDVLFNEQPSRCPLVSGAGDGVTKGFSKSHDGEKN